MGVHTRGASRTGAPYRRSPLTRVLRPGAVNVGGPSVKFTITDIPLLCSNLCNLDWTKVLSGDVAMVLMDVLPILKEATEDGKISVDSRTSAQALKELLIGIPGPDLVGRLPETWDVSKTHLRVPVYHFGKAFDKRRRADPAAYNERVAFFTANAPALIERFRIGLRIPLSTPGLVSDPRLFTPEVLKDVDAQACQMPISTPATESASRLERDGDPPCYVTLSQIAGIVQRSKKTLEKLLKRSINPMIPPHIRGKGGRPHE